MAFGDIVRSVTESNAGGEDPASLTIATGSPTVGNLYCLGIFCGDGPNAPSTAGLLEAVENHDTGQDDATGLYYRVIESGDGSTWAVDLASADQWAAALWEVEGPFEASPLDITGTNTPSDDVTTHQVSGSGTTAQASEYAVAVFGHRTVGGDSDNVTATGWSDSFTERFEVHDGLAQSWRKSVAIADRVLVSTLTPTTTVTYGATATGRSSGLIATFKEAAAAGGDPEGGLIGGKLIGGGLLLNGGVLIGR